MLHVRLHHADDPLFQVGVLGHLLSQETCKASGLLRFVYMPRHCLLFSKLCAGWLICMRTEVDESHLKVQLSWDAVDIGGNITTMQMHLLKCLADEMYVNANVIVRSKAMSCL